MWDSWGLPVAQPTLGPVLGACPATFPLLETLVLPLSGSPCGNGVEVVPGSMGNGQPGYESRVSQSGLVFPRRVALPFSLSPVLSSGSGKYRLTTGLLPLG